jgi:hypothetical protein
LLHGSLFHLVKDCLWQQQAVTQSVLPLDRSTGCQV